MLGTLWFFATYLLRLYINLFVEPVVNPIKHFPTVTVAAKLMIPIYQPILEGCRRCLGGGAALAAGFAAFTVFVLPGLAGFLVWELKENWKLYRASRPKQLAAAKIGHHGETMDQFLRPGLHSGTIPKLYMKLRRAAWKCDDHAVAKHKEALHHVEEAIWKFTDRELVSLLNEAGSFGAIDVAVHEIDIASNRVRIELACPSAGPVTRRRSRSRSSPAGCSRACRELGWVEHLEASPRVAILELALAGFYKLAGVEMVREQLEDVLRGDSGRVPPYDIVERGSRAVARQGDYASECGLRSRLAHARPDGPRPRADRHRAELRRQARHVRPRGDRAGAVGQGVGAGRRRRRAPTGSGRAEPAGLIDTRNPGSNLEPCKCTRARGTHVDRQRTSHRRITLVSRTARFLHLRLTHELPHPEGATAEIHIMPATILVTDDAQSVREMLAWELSGRGFEVVTAVDCNEAVAALHRAEFDVLVSDVNCSQDADKLVATSRRLAPDAELVVAADADHLATALACVRSGAFDYVAKPFDVDDLTATITRALERRQLRASTVLYEASRAILDANEPHRLPETIVRVAMKVMNADDVSLMLLGPGDRLYVAYSHGLPLALARDVHHGLGERVAGIVAESREPALLGEVLEHDARFANVTSYRRVRSSIVYPLTAGTRLVGVLNVNRVAEARPFRKHDLDKAAVLASQILLALDNARLVRQIATTQQLTTIGQVSSSVVHEINNPISYVLASEQHLRDRLGDVRELCEAIEHGSAPGDLRELLARAGGSTVLIDDLTQAADDIRDGAGRVRDIMRDLRAIARNRESRPVVFELASAIRSATRVVAAELRHKASVITDLADGIMMSGSPGRVSQVFVNLLVNCAEAFGARGPHVVEIVARRDDNRAIVTVRDDGPGIPRENLSRVFEPFFTTKAGDALGRPRPVDQPRPRPRAGRRHPPRHRARPRYDRDDHAAVPARQRATRGADARAAGAAGSAGSRSCSSTTSARSCAATPAGSRASTTSSPPRAAPRRSSCSPSAATSTS